MSDRSILHSLAVTLADADAVPDAELLRRYAMSADAVAFELLVRRHAELVWSVCRSVHPADHQTAEDAFQATFVALARKAVSVRDPSAAGWLFRVARNAAARAKRRPHTPLPDEVSATLSPDRTESAEVSRIVAEEVERLAAKFREPVLLCFYEGFSHAQAAERLGWAVGTVASRLARAKDRLRDRLTRRGVTLPALGIGVLTGSSAPAAAIRSAVSGATGETTDAVRKLSTEVLRSMTMTKLKLTAAGVLATVLALTGAGTALAWKMPDDEPKKVEKPAEKPAKVEKGRATFEEEYQQFQGEWKAVTAEINGEAVAADDERMKVMGFVIRGHEVRMRNTKRGEEDKDMMLLGFDHTSSPKQVNLTAVVAPQMLKGKFTAGVYEFKDGKLILCLGGRIPDMSDKNRPTEFKSAKGKDVALFVLEKVEKK